MSFIKLKSLVSLLLLSGTVFVSTARADSRLTNVSVRSAAGSGSDTLIVGFTIAGTGSKQMLIRGIGPTLADFSVPGVVADPSLTLFDSTNTQINGNDNWGGSTAVANTFASVGAFALAANSLDAAIVTALPAGSYSAQVAAKSGSGIALVEAYDADAITAPTQIINLSARSVSSAGAGVLTVGFAIAGDTKKTVLIRAVGPSLAPFGVTGVLTNPQLTLYSGKGTTLGTNDDWLPAAGWSAAFTAVGAFPLASNTRDAAMLVSLSPGTYTAQASGVNNTSGVALIEVYDVPNPPSASLVLQPVDNVATTSSTGSGNTTPGGLSTQPVVLTQARPQYPFELRRAGVTGDALIQFIVGPLGLVTDAFVVRASDSRFGDSALTAVLQWTFLPGRVNGQAVSTVMQVPIIYTLN